MYTNITNIEKLYFKYIIKNISDITLPAIDAERLTNIIDI